MIPYWAIKEHVFRLLRGFTSICCQSETANSNQHLTHQSRNPCNYPLIVFASMELALSLLITCLPFLLLRLASAALLPLLPSFQGRPERIWCLLSSNVLKRVLVVLSASRVAALFEWSLLQGSAAIHPLGTGILEGDDEARALLGGERQEVVFHMRPPSRELVILQS